MAAGWSRDSRRQGREPGPPQESRHEIMVAWPRGGDHQGGKQWTDSGGHFGGKADRLCQWVHEI